MSDIYKFEDTKIRKINSEDYAEDEFLIARMDFLGSNPNAHGLIFGEEVFQRDVSSVLGKWVVAKIYNGDAEGHEPDEIICGQVIKDQDVEIYRNEDGYLRAVVDVVLSKIYAKECCDIFSYSDHRSVSIEADCFFAEDDTSNVMKFNILGVTILGQHIKPSSAGSNIQVVRFSEESANEFYHLNKENHSMEEKYENHPIDTSKEAMSEADWDGDKAKSDLVKEEKYETLAPKVCLKLEEGWEERQVTKLGYPVMGLSEGKWVYFRKALASAKAYATQENDEEVLKKVNDIYEKLGLVEEEKEEEKMECEPEEEKMEVPTFDFEAECARLKAECEKLECEKLELQSKCDEQSSLIMQKDAELESLRAFKTSIDNNMKLSEVNAVLDKIKNHVTEDKYQEFASSAEKYSFADIAGWKNIVFAYCGEQMVNKENENIEEEPSTFRMSIPKSNPAPKDFWDRL